MSELHGEALLSPNSRLHTREKFCHKHLQDLRTSVTLFLSPLHSHIQGPLEQAAAWTHCVGSQSCRDTGGSGSGLWAEGGGGTHWLLGGLCTQELGIWGLLSTPDKTVSTYCSVCLPFARLSHNLRTEVIRPEAALPLLRWADSQCSDGRGRKSE